ncbi:MAG: T9SS type A sorting domain-containing protein [Aureispira sp.]
MLKLILLISLFHLIVLSSYAQMPSSCNGSTTFNASYEEDVKELAILAMLASGTADSNSINILPSYKQDISSALAAVGNITSVSNEADSVFNQYCIHNGSWGASGNSVLHVNLIPSAPWTSNWLNNTPLSGNPTIDNLLAGQSYTVSANSVSSTLPYLVTLTFNDIINTKPIIEQLTGLSGIDFIEDVSFFGDGNRITYSKVGNIAYLDFNLGWGDCYLGCIARRIWSFSIELTTCEVSYLGVTGSDPGAPNTYTPDQPNCNLTLSTSSILRNKASIRVFPNPTTNLLHVEGKTQDLKLYNSTGSLVVHKTANSTLETLDLSLLTRGVYMLLVNNRVTKTIIKQ